MVKQSGRDFVCEDYCRRRTADVKFAPRIVRRKINSFGRYFGLKNRRDRLRFAREPAFHPAKLRRVECGELDHRDAHVAFVV